MTLGKLRKEKIESIRKTFERTNSLKETAEIEGVVDRTVSKHGTPKEVDISAGPNSSSRRSVDDIVNPPSDISFKVYKAFENGSTNIAVCLKFKLSPELVMRYREEYHTMKKADFDVELEKRNIVKTEVEAAIQRRKEELNDVEARVQKENARLIELQDRVSRGSDGYLEGFLQKMEVVPENQICEYTYRLITSNFYARAMVELNVRMVLGAIARHPNFEPLLHELRKGPFQKLQCDDDIRAADGVDVRILVNDVKNYAVRSAMTWRERWQEKNYYEKRKKQSSQAE